MYNSNKSKHICMLPEGPKCRGIPPTGGCCRHFRCILRGLLQPNAWHHGSALFHRSRKSLRLEQDRQVSSGYWMMWHPYSPARMYWDCIFVIINVMAFIYMPLEVFYECPNPYNPFILTADLIACFAICVNFLTGIVDEDGKKVVLKPKRIAIRYIRGSFITDLIGALPLQLIQPFKDCRYPSHTVMFIFKPFRITCISRSWKNIYQQLEMSYMVSVCVTVLVRATMFFHWVTYIHYQVPVICAHILPIEGPVNLWMKRFKVICDPPDSCTVMDKYIMSLYYVAGICIGAGIYSPIDVHVIPEMLLNSTLGIVGLLFMTYSFTTLIRIVVYKHFENYLYNGRLKELHEYLTMKRLPQCLQQKIHLFINYKFNGHYFNEGSIMNTVNEQIKQDINMYCCKRLVLNVPLFQDMPIALINTIIFSLTQVLYMPGEVVVKYGHPGSSLYLIAFGTVAVMNSEGKEVAHQKDGAYFGERALLNPGTPRSATVIALEITEIYKLNNKQFEACLEPCPRLKKRLEDAVTSRHARRVGRRSTT